MQGMSLMTASWTSHGRAVLAACLTLLLLFAPSAHAAGDIDRLLARDDHKRSAFTEVRAIRAAEAKAAKAKAAAAAASATTAKAAADDDYGESTPLDLPADVQAGPDRASTSGSLGRTLLGLLVVVGLIYGLTHVLRRMRDGAQGGARTDGLKAVASIPLGPGRSIHLVRAGQEYLLVGAAEHGVVPLRTYTEDEAVAAGLLDLDPKATPAAARPAPAAAPARAAARPVLAVRPQLDLQALLDGLRARTVRR
jgi:flagellar protein FliO/FliZ